MMPKIIDYTNILDVSITENGIINANQCNIEVSPNTLNIPTIQNCTTIQCNTVQCNTIQCTTIECTTIDCTTIACNNVRCSQCSKCGNLCGD